MSRDTDNSRAELPSRMSALRMHDVDDLRKERIRLRARDVLAARSETARESAFVRSGICPRYIEPALVSCLSLFVLVWVIERTMFLLTQ